MNESLVGITPAGVLELTKNMHMVYVQSITGKQVGTTRMVGALILDTAHIEQKNTPELNSRVLAN